MPSSIIKILLNATSLVSHLSQNATNGASVLGTVDTPKLPQFFTDNPLPNGFPWGTATVNNTNPYKNPPTTGVIRYYNFTIARGFVAPDGINRSVILVNGAFPGPTMEANWGDTFQVTVNNQITGPEEGTSMHWHGILQQKSQWYDGTSGITQCPIAPGKSFTYSFQADLYGSSWYHSHYSAQYSGGIYGPMIIHGPNHVNYDIDIGPVILNDWYHQDYFSLLQGTMAAPPVTPTSDNNLINGKMEVDCSTVSVPCTPSSGISKFTFQSGKVHRLRLMNVGSEATMHFTIDNHTMTIIANDFVPVQPYTTNVVTLGVGQRTDILVNATLNSTSAVWMRSDMSSCSLTTQPNALAAIYYENANTTSRPSSVATAYTDVCANDALSKTIPYYPIAAPATPSVTQVLNFTASFNATGHFVWYINNVTSRINYNDPILLLSKTGNDSYPYSPEWNVYNFGTNSSVRLILQNWFQVAHPMHMHGHNFFVVAEGVGAWDGTRTNVNNPARRDTHILQASPNPGVTPAYLVIEFNMDNAGVWPLHCHIAWHVSAGLSLGILERPDLIQSMTIPSTLAQTCRDWAAYTNTTVVDQIDSGL